jgi:hypothetical protein
MPALKSDAVLREEAKAIHAADLGGKQGVELYRSLNGLNASALCLSGGGIRSASFALGVIQALATHPRTANGDRVQKPEDSLLAKFHYLSTVSGGGYIGSWLSAWVTRTGFADVWSNLVGRPKGSDIEPPALAWLRSYSNYLTPKLGLTSADFWAALAIVLRNLILNWMVVLPALCLALLALKGFAIAVAWFSQFDPRSCAPWFFAAAAAGCISLVVTLFFTTRNRPTRGSSNAGQTAFLWGDLIPAVLSGIFFTFALASPCGFDYLYQEPMPAFAWNGVSIFGLGLAGGLAIYLVSWIIAWPKCRVWKDFVGDIVAWLVAGAVYGALMALGVYLYMKVYGPGLWPVTPGEVLLIVFGVPWALASQLLAEMIFVAFSSYQADSDSDREWLGRAAGWYLLVILAWPILMILVFVAGPFVIDIVYKDYRTWAAGAGTGGLVAWLGKSGLTSAKGAVTGIKGLSANLILAIAAPVFAVILIVLTSAVLDQLLFGDALIRTVAFKAAVTLDTFPAWPGGWWLLIGAGIALVVGTVASIWVNINRFSLHAMYRNRLIRAFLGASQGDKRKPNKFTDFDDRDNPHMRDLLLPYDKRDKPNAPKPGWRPFHLVNIALNIVSTKRLAWQERKAESFTVSALHSGAAGILVGGGDGTVPACGAYRPSAEYGGGISLGTALAISGAAASPNMGYHSSPALALLMTMFNVRLGWWLGNPAIENIKIYGGEGPRVAIAALLNEMFGQTTDDGNYVYLSDGGHFENLGIYEMVRRRCRFIVVSDAGCDKEFQFEDLGNAVRKIWIDLGIRISFTGLNVLRDRAREDIVYEAGLPPFFAVGTIDYPAADGGASKPGTILYIKPCFHRNRIENVGVRNYAALNADFPHEGTGDQFFSESQFESYRALGFEMTDSVLSQAFEDFQIAPATTLDDIFGRFKTVGGP